MEASNFIGVTMQHGAVILFSVRILHCRIAFELLDDGLTLPLLFTISSDIWHWLGVPCKAAVCSSGSPAQLAVNGM